MTPATNRIEITLSDDKLAALDDARGREPRASFIKHALDMALSASETPEAPREAPKRNGPRTINRDGTHRPTCKCPVCQPKAKR